MKYKIISEIVQSAEEFYNSYGREPYSTQELYQWAYRKQLTSQPNTVPQAPIEEHRSDTDSIESIIARRISLLYRYAKHYIKKALDGTPLTSVDDFSYLAAVCFTSHLTKTELIAMNIHEKTTGIEIIKRLVQRNLIEEIPNPADGRSKIVQITDHGRYVFFSIVKPMLRVSDIVAGNLTLEEKHILIALLDKLHAFHEPLFRDYHDMSLSELSPLVKDSISRSDL